MNFTSLEFIIFFPVVLILYWAMPGHRRWVLLLAASYLFYMSGSLRSGALLLFTTGVSYMAALQMEKIRSEKGAGTKGIKMWMLFALVCCLGCLTLWKRKDFLAVGISFYTFQTLGYVLDVYHGRIPCERHFGYYALFVSFFPQLVAGPIERTENLLPQLKKVQAWKRNDFADGCWLLLKGFYKKLAVADYLATFVDVAYASPGEIGGLGAIFGILCFAGQIYCDFSGYTDIARGTARMMGIHLIENFEHPYGAEDIREFWKRWHMSLTKWFTDYVYIPLGGSRKGTLVHCRNIMVVFLLSGLWHGLSWNYVVWGMMHGLCFVVYTLWGQKAVRPSQRDSYCGMLRGWVRHLVFRFAVFGVVCFAWIFFRAENIRKAGQIIGQILFHFADRGILETLQFMQIQRIDVLLLPLVLLCLLLVDRMPDTIFRVTSLKETVKVSFLGFYMVNAIALSWLILAAADRGNSFIYFRF